MASSPKLAVAALGEDVYTSGNTASPGTASFVRSVAVSAGRMYNKKTPQLRGVFRRIRIPFGILYGVPTGIRTPVLTVKGWCPRPLDDRDNRGSATYQFYCKSTVKKLGGASRDRTGDLLHAMQALSQLSYGPVQRRRIIDVSCDARQVIPKKSYRSCLPSFVADANRSGSRTVCTTIH
jgi:hypothetical protein